MSSKLPKNFKLISGYKEEWETSKKILSQLQKKCTSKKSLEEKYEILISTIQIFESKHRFNQFNAEDIIMLHTKRCIGLKAAIKLYFQDNEESFFTDILPFIIEQALLLFDRAKSKYGEQTLPLMISGKARKEEVPKK